MAISRMQNPQQLQGIGSLRQPYGLGKLVKKAFRGIKKIAKSPIGKAALIGGGLWGLNKFGPAKGWFGKMMGPGAGKSWMGKAGNFLNPWAGGTFSGKKLFGLGAGLAIGAPLIQKALGYGPYKEDEGEEDDWTTTPLSIANLRNQAKDYYKAATPDYTGSPFMPQKQFVMSDFYGADGGIVGLANGGNPGEAQMEQMLRAEYLKYRNQGGTMPYEQFKILVMKQAQQGQTPNQMMAAGGRMGYFLGKKVGYASADPNFTPSGNFKDNILNIFSNKLAGKNQVASGLMIRQDRPVRPGDPVGSYYAGAGGLKAVSPVSSSPINQGSSSPINQGGSFMANMISQSPVARKQLSSLQDADYQAYIASGSELPYQEWKASRGTAAEGGRIGAQEGGALMDLGGQEKDYREDGGFVPLGEEERADDVPARLSKNEFVFTADAVRAAGGGDIDAGSEVMQNVMDNLEQGGEVSEDSQGLAGGEEMMSEEIIDESNPAQGMYDNYEQLQSRVA